jgi:glutamate--cysteine ligase
VWTDTDPDRSGTLPFAFEEGFGFERYVDYALDVPMYFVRRGGKYVDCSGLSFRDFMAGKLPMLPGELPAMDDFDDHISTIFPEVRLKTFLEMRGADASTQARLCALSAFWAGILYDSKSLDGAWELVKAWTAGERETMRNAVPAVGLQATIRNTNVQSIAKQAVALARDGLKRRKNLNSTGEDETIFLSELEEIADSGLSPADRLLAKYNGEWKRDLRRAFVDTRF